MPAVRPLTAAIGAEFSSVTAADLASTAVQDQLYDALLEHLVVIVPRVAIAPRDHLALAESFGQLDEPHPHYPHVEGFDRIVKLENDAERPPDTNSWHTDLTFRREQPFASILVARTVPAVGGDTLWSSCYAAYDRLSAGMKADLADLHAIHDMGDFRNDFVDSGATGNHSLDEAMARFGHRVRPLVDSHPVTGRRFLNFNEAFVTHIVGMTTNDSVALRTWLANHMNKPEDQLRWRWSEGDLVMWDNRVTMHYAVADYLPAYRCMNRVTVVKDRRAPA